MDVSFRFRQIQPSVELEQYTLERIPRLARFEGKPIKAEVTFSMERSMCRIDIHVRGLRADFHCTVKTDNFFGGVDLAIQKMGRQLEKKKAQIKKVS